LTALTAALAKRPMALMTQPAAHLPTAHPWPRLAPLAGWLILQLLALLLPVLQLPLSDNFTRPAERLAIEEMLTTQIAFAALLMPVLFSNCSTSLFVIACTWPFIQLAGTLSATPPTRILLATAYLAGWLALLTAWRSILRTTRAQMIGVAAASILSIGAALLWYLRVEFLTQQTDPLWSRDALLGPILAALAILHEQPLSFRPWLPLGIALVVSVSLASWIEIRRRRAAAVTSNPTQER